MLGKPNYKTKRIFKWTENDCWQNATDLYTLYYNKLFLDFQLKCLIYRQTTSICWALQNNWTV